LAQSRSLADILPLPARRPQPAATTTVLLLKGDYGRTGGPESLLRDLAGSIDRARFDLVLGIIRRPGAAPASHYPPSLREQEIPWQGIGAVAHAARRVAWLARERGARLIHTHDMRANLVAAALRPFRPIPWVAHVHGWLGDTHRGRYKIYEAIDRWLVPRADLVLVGSAAAGREARACGARRVVVVPNAVAIPPAGGDAGAVAAARAALGVPDDAVLLGMVGRLHPGKGHDIFLHALAILARERPNLCGAIVGEGEGEGEDEARLRALAASLGLARRVAFTGFVADTDAYVRAMDVVMVPSRKDSLPLVALEAMARGRPVIASDTGDLPTAVIDGTCGFIVPVGDAAALADRARILLDDPARRRRMGQAARARAVDAYSAEAMARRLEDSYADLLARVPAHAG
jgi:glycosyltransferase involved in cell wall biosynthesis